MRWKGKHSFQLSDLWLGYHQLRIKEGGIAKTIFRTRFWNYDFLVEPFGLTNVLTIIMSLVNNVFRKYLDQFVQVLLVSVLIYYNNESEHKEHLWMVFSFLRKHNLYSKLSKFSFYEKQIHYIG